MKIEVNIHKKHMIFLFALFLVGTVYAVVSHNAVDVVTSIGGRSADDVLTELYNYKMGLETFTPGDIMVAGDLEGAGAKSRNFLNLRSISIGQAGSANFSADLKASTASRDVELKLQKNGVDVGSVCRMRSTTPISCSEIISFNSGDTITILARGEDYASSTNSYTGITTHYGEALVSNIQVKVANQIPVIAMN